MIPNENDQIVGSIRQLTENEGLAKNTDREIWRKVLDDYYSPSIHVTVDGKIGINCHGLVCVMPVEKWHDLNAENERLKYLIQVIIDDGLKSKFDMRKWRARAAEALKGEKL